MLNFIIIVRDFYRTAMKEDFYDIVDYNGGLDGEYSNIDYHDLEDYYGD